MPLSFSLESTHAELSALLASHLTKGQNSENGELQRQLPFYTPSPRRHAIRTPVQPSTDERKVGYGLSNLLPGTSTARGEGRGEGEKVSDCLKLLRAEKMREDSGGE